MELQLHSKETLIDLYHAVDGKAGHFVDATEAKHQCLFALERRGIITIETSRHRGKRKRRAALTDSGKFFAEGDSINAPKSRPKDPALMPKTSDRTRISIYFQLNLDDQYHVDTLERVNRLKKAGRFNPTIRALLELEERLGIEALESLTAEKQLLSELRKDLEKERVELDKAWAELEAKQKNQQAIHDLNNRLIQFEDFVKSGAVAQTAGQVGLRKIEAPKIEAPHFDDEDDDLLIVEKNTGNGSAAMNLINGLLSLNSASKKDLVTAVAAAGD